jgi:hypothetical protein
VGRGTCPIHDGIDPGFDGAIAALSRVLVLVIGFRVPARAMVNAQDVQDFVGYFDFGIVADEHVHGSPESYVIFEGIDKLLRRFEGIGIGNKCVFAHKNLCFFNTGVDGGCV